MDPLESLINQRYEIGPISFRNQDEFRRVIVQLSKHQDERAVRALVDLADDGFAAQREEYEICLVAKQALIRMGNFVVEPLIKYLDDGAGATESAQIADILGTLGDPRAVSALVKLLYEGGSERHYYDSVRDYDMSVKDQPGKHAATALANMKPEGIQAMELAVRESPLLSFESLRKPLFRGRMIISEKIYDRDQKMAVKIALENLINNVSSARNIIGNKNLANWLSDPLKSDNESLSKVCVAPLAQCGSEGAAVLVSAYQNVSPDLQKVIIGLIIYSKAPKIYVPFLIEVINNAYDEIGSLCIRALGKSKDPSAFDFIYQLLEDPRYQVAACRAIGEFNDARAIPRLKKLAGFWSREDKDVKDAARDALYVMWQIDNARKEREEYNRKIKELHEEDKRKLKELQKEGARYQDRLRKEAAKKAARRRES